MIHSKRNFNLLYFECNYKSNVYAGQTSNLSLYREVGYYFNLKPDYFKCFIEIKSCS